MSRLTNTSIIVGIIGALALLGILVFASGDSDVRAAHIGSPTGTVDYIAIDLEVGAEFGVECAFPDAVDDDADGATNDGCPQVGTISEASIFACACAISRSARWGSSGNWELTRHG